MFFHVRAKNTTYSEKPGTVTLHQDFWDDFGFKTLFSISYCDSEGYVHDLGSVHIGFKGMKIGKVIDALNSEFDELPGHFFSLGSFEEYFPHSLSYPCTHTLIILMMRNGCLHFHDKTKLYITKFIVPITGTAYCKNV